MNPEERARSGSFDPREMRRRAQREYRERKRQDAERPAREAAQRRASEAYDRRELLGKPGEHVQIEWGNDYRRQPEAPYHFYMNGLEVYRRKNDGFWVCDLCWKPVKDSDEAGWPHCAACHST